MATHPIHRPQGKNYGDSIVVDNEKVYLLIGGRWYYYSKQRKPIGIGGMGSVLLGYACDDGTAVAIKRIKPEFGSKSNIRARVKLESELSFNHPNLVETLGYCEGTGAESPMFVVSKFIRGQTIDIYVNSFFTPGLERTKHVIAMLRQIASAIDFIHSKGIIHLDIKPSNIMVERGSTLKLLDLGIADVADRSIKTTGYGLHGTEGYAAPEQYVDKDNPSLKIDRRTDVYGLAATAYFLITGTLPGKQADRADPNVGKEAHKVFKKALSHEKDARYDSATEFIEQLEKAYVADGSHRQGSRIRIIIYTIIVIVSLAIIVSLIGILH